MNKRILSAILITAMLGGLLSGCKGKLGEEGDYVTRGEWIAMLVDGFALDHVTGGTPYFEDISAGSPWFEVTQTAGAWDLLLPFSGNKLNADKPITREEAAATAAIAAGFRVGEEFQIKQAVDFAAQKGILLSDGQKYVTAQDGEAAIETAVEVYLNDPGEERMVVVQNPALVDLRDLTPAGNVLKVEELTPEGALSQTERLLYAIWAGSVTKDESGQNVATLPWGGEYIALRPGDTFIAPPTAEHPAGVAYKITAIFENSGAVMLEVQPPELADLYEKIDVHTTISANTDNIIWAQGVSATGKDGEYTISLLSNGKKETPLLDKSFTFASGNYEKKWSNPSSYLGNSTEAQAFKESNFVYEDMPGIQDFDGGTISWEKKLLTENKFEAGYKITGNLTIQSIDITPDIQFYIPPVPSAASISIQADMSANLKLEGNLNERLKVASIPIVVTPLGLTVTADIYLYVDASGAIQAEAQLGYSSKAEWRMDCGFRKSQNCSMKTELGVEADIGFGGDISAAVYAFGLNIIDAGAKVGGEITAEAKVVGNCDEAVVDGLTTITYKESMKVDATLYAPIVTLYAGSEDSLINETFDVGGEWDIYTKENTRSWPLLDQEWVFWQKTVQLDEDGNVIPSGPLEGDFSEFAGEYRMADEELEIRYANYCTDCPNIILHEDGRITLATQPKLEDGRSYYPYETDIVPSSIEEVFPERSELPDGSSYEYGAHGYRCVLWESPDYERLKDEVAMAPGEFYTIYPDGLSWPSDDGVCIEYHRGLGTADDSYGYYIKVD